MFHPCSHFEAKGRLTKPLVLTCDDPGVLVCENEKGFKITVPLSSNKLKDVVCTLENGTTIKCEGHIDKAGKTIRLDAVNQKEYAWFWFQVAPNLQYYAAKAKPKPKAKPMGKPMAKPMGKPKAKPMAAKPVAPHMQPRFHGLPIILGD